MWNALGCNDRSQDGARGIGKRAALQEATLRSNGHTREVAALSNAATAGAPVARIVEGALLPLREASPDARAQAADIALLSRHLMVEPAGRNAGVQTRVG